MADIYGRIGLVMRDMPAIGKEQKNLQQGWKFRGIDMIMNYVEPLFVKHGVFVVPQVLDSVREERATKNGGNMIYTKLRIRYTFYATSDGSSVEAIVDGEGMDTGDKSTNKALAVGMKYALFQVLCIPTEEMEIPERLVDPDETTPEESRPVRNLAGEEVYHCEDCGIQLGPMTGKDGKTLTVAEQLLTIGKYTSRILCPDCFKKTIRKGA